MMNLKKLGDWIPTIFDLPEVWEINASRCGGRYNALFFWTYPIAAVILLPVTVLALIEVALTTKSKDLVKT